ncbi:MAG: hypothetical protein PGN33_13405 [Methylobacterium radiotolerans]
MATQAHRLTFLLRLAGSDAGTTRQTVTITTETVDEAVELARFYRAGLPSESLISATLASASGDVLWSEQADTAAGSASLHKDRP